MFESTGTKLNRILLELISGLLILLFVYAAVTKVADFKTTLHEIDNQVLPHWLTPWLAVGIPLAELLIVAGLFTRRFKMAALYASLALMAVFTIYIGLALLNVYQRMPCSCGGVLKHMGWRAHFFFNLFYVLITLVAIRAGKRLRQVAEVPAGANGFACR
jgi:hypothetical protein